MKHLRETQTILSMFEPCEQQAATLLHGHVYVCDEAGTLRSYLLDLGST